MFLNSKKFTLPALSSRWEPSNFFDPFNQIVDEFFNNKYKPRMREIYQQNSKFPAIEILQNEKDEELKIKLFISGYSKENINVEYSSETQSLVVSGNSEIKNESNENECIYSEVKRSNFTRSIPINIENIKNIEDIKCSMENGVLEVVVPYIFPKKELPKSKKLFIE